MNFPLDFYILKSTLDKIISFSKTSLNDQTSDYTMNLLFKIKLVACTYVRHIKKEKKKEKKGSYITFWSTQ